MNPKTSAAPSPPSERSVLDALRADVRLPKVSASYQLGLLIVAVAMVILPLIYLGLIALTGYGVYYHAVHNTGMLLGTGVRLRLLLYATPILVGGILFLFMIKPLFAKPPPHPEAHRLRRGEQPLLFAFVEKLCRTLRAPIPTRINVDVEINASAGLHLDMVSITRKDTILTIGLPLVAGMSLTELTGVLSHEFGHFRQGSGMRVSQLVRRINHWFARVVYERDEWDEHLVKWSQEESWFSIVALLGRLFVWLSRRVLWLLMVVGHAISSLLMRQMEFDADQYEVLIAGSDTFAQTALRLRTLTVANAMAFSELADSWRERRLSESLPLHIAAKAESFSKDTVDAIERSALEETTGLFDTHPSDQARIDRALRANQPGIFRVQAPAAILFRNFEDLCRRVTREYYQQALGAIQDDSLVSTEAFQKHQERHRSGEQAVPRYFQGLLNGQRMLKLDARANSPAPARKALENLLVARMRIEETLPGARKAFDEFGRAREMMSDALAASYLLEAGLKPDAESFHLPTANHQGVDRLEQRAKSVMEARSREVEAWEDNLRVRLVSAIQCLEAPEVTAKLPEAPSLLKQARKLLSCQKDLQEALSEVTELGDKLEIITLLGGQLEEHATNEVLVANIAELAREMQQGLAAITQSLRAVSYPFPRTDENISVSDYLLPDIPHGFSISAGGDASTLDGEALGQIVAGAQELCQRYFALHLRVLGQLALLGEKVEEAVGLPPLSEPKVPG